MSTLTRTADRPGERADAFLARVVPDLTRSAAQRLLEAGAVRLAGRPVRKNYRTAPGDVLEVDIPAPQPVDLVPQDIPLDIVYEDGDVIVVNKPVGMVVHPAPDIRTARWSMPCYITVEIPSLGSTAPCAPASSTASTGTPAA